MLSKHVYSICSCLKGTLNDWYLLYLYHQVQLKTIAEIRFGLLQRKRIYDINKTLVIGTCMLFL